MDSTKSNVVKSKSSNSNIKTKDERGPNKKSRSNAEFQEPHVFKKRGVYVEKKTTELSINAQERNGVQAAAYQYTEPDNAQQKQPDALLSAPVKAPRRPKRGQKPFLDSVLTILSQCTTSTQYPDPDEAINEFTFKTVCADRYLDRKKHRRAVIKANKQTVEEGTQKGNAIAAKQKSEYISKVLTDEMLRLNDRVTVLQEKRQINLTPSNYSAMSSTELIEAKKWQDLPLGKDNATEESPIRKLLNENIHGNIVKEKAKQMVENTKLESKKVSNNVEPLSQVSEDRQRDARGMYNFFIDLLETTFSIYNVKADYNATTPSEFDSRTALEIDEEIANKLIFTKETIDEPEPIPDSAQNAYKIKYYSISDDLPAVPNIKPQPKSGDTTFSRRTQRTTKLKSESFPFAKQYKTESPRNRKTVPSKRTSNKKDKKQALFDSLKEQLQMDVDAYEEPQNIYQALKIIAKNKKENQKTTHFYETPRDNDHNHDECVFKRQKFFSESTKKHKKTTKPANFENNFMKSLSNSTGRKSKVNTQVKVKFSDSTNYSNFRNDVTSTYYESNEESYHSIEVEGYDYEEPPKTANENEVVIADMRLIFSNTDLKSKRMVKKYLDYQSLDSFTDWDNANREDLTFSSSDSIYMTKEENQFQNLKDNYF